MDQWIEIRRRVLNHEISRRQACREYGLHWQTLKKILLQPMPPEKRAAGVPRASKLDRFRPVIDAILDADKTTHRKQRHTAWRIASICRRCGMCRKKSFRSTAIKWSCGHTLADW